MKGWKTGLKISNTSHFFGVCYFENSFQLSCRKYFSLSNAPYNSANGSLVQKLHSIEISDFVARALPWRKWHAVLVGSFKPKGRNTGANLSHHTWQLIHNALATPVNSLCIALPPLSLTAIPRWEYGFPSDQPSQATLGPLSTWIGDGLGIEGAVSILHFCHRK